MSRQVLNSSFKSKNLRIVVVGKTGVGKSSLCNLILRKNAFMSSPDCCSVTTTTMASSAYVNNINITVVDTPGLFSLDYAMIDTAIELQDSLQKVKPGPNIFLIVVKLGRFGPEDADTIDFLKIIFGPNILQHAIIVFTHEDQVTKKGNKIQDAIASFEKLEGNKALLDGCGSRHLTINCDEEDDKIKATKLARLLEIICSVTENGNKYYTEDYQMYRTVLQKHAREWTDIRLSKQQMQILLQDQLQEKQKQIEEKEEQSKKKEQEYETRLENQSKEYETLLAREREDKEILMQTLKIGGCILGGVGLGTLAIVGIGAGAIGLTKVAAEGAVGLLTKGQAIMAVSQAAGQASVIGIPAMVSKTMALTGAAAASAVISQKKSSHKQH